MDSRARYVLSAKSAGVPRDQLLNFVRGGYVAQPMQLRFHAAARLADQSDGPTEIGVGGARGPGKSHCTFAQMALDDCQRVDGLKCLYLRRIGVRAREQFEDLRRAVLRYVEHDYRRSDGVATFPNGSMIVTGHFKDEKDVDNYLGFQYDAMTIEETTGLSISKYQALRDSCRTSKRNWRPRIYNSTNPGGVGHAWYKKLFILPFRRQEESDTRFIFGTVEDNKFLNPEYRTNLEKNVGWRLRAYRYGDWDILAGQFFTNWNYAAHVVRPFEIPLNWRVWMSMDYGFVHWNVVHLFGEGDSHTHVIDEVAVRKTLPVQAAQQVTRMLERNNVTRNRVRTFVAGADVFTKRGVDSGASIADAWEREGYHLTCANQDRINGAAECLQAFGGGGVAPTVSIFDRCVRLVECIPMLEHDPHRPEDVLKVDADAEGDGGDDAYDSFRYGMMEKTRKQTVTWGRSPTAGYRG